MPTNQLRISLLGAFRIALDGHELGSPIADKARALLAYLAVEAYRRRPRPVAHRRESLAGLLWPDQPDSAALHSLRQALSQLRKALEDAQTEPSLLRITRQTLQMNPEGHHWLDVKVFSAFIAACRAHQHPRLETCGSCARRLETAATLYRGDFCSHLSVDSAPFEEWVVVQREELHRQALWALQHLATYHELRGEYEQAIDCARRQVELEPWQEQAHRQVMRALALSGQRSAALTQYEVCRRTLEEELGVEPEGETTALYERIRQGSELGVLSPGTPHNLPAPLTPFVGREAVLAEIARRLQDPGCRLLTLTGPGGVGKTRLALEAARRELGNYPQGVFFVSLAPLQSPEAIVPTVAQALGLPLGGPPSPGGDAGEDQTMQRSPSVRQLLDYLFQKRILLVLDNLEHLVEGTGLLSDILRWAPQVTILATSRTGLRVPGEHRFVVDGMAVPAGDWDAKDPQEKPPRLQQDVASYSAIQLFLQGARRARRDFQLADDNRAATVEICRMVDGVPLAILLSAAWVEILTPSEIAAELAEIGRGLDFLTTEEREVPDRQRSMRAAFDHSWKLLAAREQELMAELSLFRGGFTQGAAQEVCGASLRELMGLVGRSLLQRTPGERYEMHGLLRQYAAEKLDRRPDRGEAARKRFCDHYCGALQRWEMDLKSDRQVAALGEMDVEIENTRTAWLWAAERQLLEQVDRGVRALSLFCRHRHRREEGRSLFGEAAERLSARVSGSVAPRSAAAQPEVAPEYDAEAARVLAKVLAAQSFFSEPAAARELCQRSLTLLEIPGLSDRDTRAERALALLGEGAAWPRLDRARSIRALKQSSALYQALGDRYGTARALCGLAMVTRFVDYGEARLLARESLAMHEALGAQLDLIFVRTLLGLVAMHQGELEEARRWYQECLSAARAVGGQTEVALVSERLGDVDTRLGRFDDAQEMLEQAIALYRDLGSMLSLTRANHYLGGLALHQGRYGQARSLGQGALAFYQERELRFESGNALCLLGKVAMAEGARDEAQGFLEESIALWREMGGPTGSTEILLARAKWGLGWRDRAWEHVYEALRTAIEMEWFTELEVMLASVALLLADEGKVERAVEVYASASRYPLLAHSQWFEDVFGRHITDAAESLPPQVVAAAQERGRERDQWETAKELLAELEGEGDHDA